MDRSEVIILAGETRTQDANGIWQMTGTQREVFCQVDSVTRNEFFEGGRNGLNPEFVFRMFAGDYEGERIAIYDGKSYSIYRTYLGRQDIIELYAERKGGTNTGPEEPTPPTPTPTTPSEGESDGEEVNS